MYSVTSYSTCCFLLHLQLSKNYIKELSWTVTKYSVRVEFGPAGPNVSDIFGPAGPNISDIFGPAGLNISGIFGPVGLKYSTISVSGYQMISL